MYELNAQILKLVMTRGSRYVRALVGKERCVTVTCDWAGGFYIARVSSPTAGKEAHIVDIYYAQHHNIRGGNAWDAVCYSLTDGRASHRDQI